MAANNAEEGSELVPDGSASVGRVHYSGKDICLERSIKAVGQFLGAFAKLFVSLFVRPSVRLSVSPHGTVRFKLDDFS